MSLSRVAAGCFLSTLAVFAVAGTAQAATVYDAVNDFSGTNPSGVWTYAYHDTAGVYTKFDVFHTPFAGLDAWQNSDGSCCGGGTGNNSALIAKNTSGSVLNYETISLPTTYLAMDPESNQSVDLIFTAPTAGTYNVKYMFDGIDTQAGQHGAGHDTDVLINGLVYAPSAPGYIGKFGDSAGGSFSVSLLGGETIDFQTLTSPTTFAYLSTGVQADISSSTSPVPLPGSAPMFGAALVALGAIGYGLKRRAATA